MKKNVPSTDPNGDAKRQSLEKAEQLMIVNIGCPFLSNVQLLIV